MDWDTGQYLIEINRKLELLMRAANIPTEDEEVKTKGKKGSAT